VNLGPSKAPPADNRSDRKVVSGSDRRIYEIIYIRLVFFRIFKCDQIDRKGREEEREKRKDAAVKGRSITFLIN
jgi:hypothetical protein